MFKVIREADSLVEATFILAAHTILFLGVAGITVSILTVIGFIGFLALVSIICILFLTAFLVRK